MDATVLRWPKRRKTAKSSFRYQRFRDLPEKAAEISSVGKGPAASVVTPRSLDKMRKQAVDGQQHRKQSPGTPMATAEQDTQTCLITVFGENVRYRRKWRRWTQEDLAARANLHPMAISQIERAKTNPTLATVETISRALKLDPAAPLDHARRKPAKGAGSKNSRDLGIGEAYG